MLWCAIIVVLSGLESVVKVDVLASGPSSCISAMCSHRDFGPLALKLHNWQSNLKRFPLCVSSMCAVSAATVSNS